MSWENVLKMPWLQNIDFDSHDAPRIGRYIKYLENLLDETHRLGFKRWWSMGRIKTLPRPEGEGFNPEMDRTGHSYQGPQSAQKAGEYREWTRDLPSSGLAHMKAYFERNKDIDSDMDIAYEKEYEDDPDSALEKADEEFEELIEDLEELLDDMRKRYVAFRVDSASRAIELMRSAMKEMSGKDIPAEGQKDENGSYYTMKESHHGVIINIYPHWLPRSTRMEGGRHRNITHLRLRLNITQGPGEWNFCYMDGKRNVAELCIYKGDWADTPPGDSIPIFLTIAFMADSARQFSSQLGGYNWGNTRQSGGNQAGNVKEWHYLPEDSSWYTKGMNIIRNTLEELKKIGREWDSEIRAVEYTHGGKLPIQGERLTDEWETTNVLADKKPSQKKWWQRVAGSEKDGE